MPQNRQPLTCGTNVGLTGLHKPPFKMTDPENAIVPSGAEAGYAATAGDNIPRFVLLKKLLDHGLLPSETLREGVLPTALPS